MFAAAYFGLVNVKLELPGEAVVALGCDTACHRSDTICFSVQYVLLTDEDFVKTTDMVCVVNVVLALAIYLVILLSQTTRG